MFNAYEVKSMYKKLFWIFLILTTFINIQFSVAQSAIPDFKATMNYENDIDSVLRSVIPHANLIIAYRLYNNWTIKKEYKLLCFKQGHWSKYLYNSTKPTIMDPNKEPLKECKTSDEACLNFYNELASNGIFTIEDDTKYPPCNSTDTIINGKKITKRHDMEDGPKYFIWLITPTKSRHLYFYAPAYYLQYCKGDRKQFLKIVEIFNKEW